MSFYEEDFDDEVRNILVVDDDPGIIKCLPYCFDNDETISLEFAENVATASKLLDDHCHEIDLVLLDRHLGQGSHGEDLLPLIKQRRLMLILISGNNEYLRQKAKEAGVVVVGECQKVFDVSTLRECVYATLGDHAPTDD